MTEYAIGSIPVKNYKKGLVFLVAKTVKYITNHLITEASKESFTKVKKTLQYYKLTHS